MALDEVRALPICRITLLGNGDDLQNGNAAIAERRSQLVEISWPIAFTDRFEHLDRGDAVVLPLHVPVVEKSKISASGLALAGEARVSIGKLFARKRYAGYGTAETANETLGQRAPAASDLQDAFAALELEQASDTIELRLLGTSSVSLAA